jgi:eukaryotic-like serine/threonine-protein kinase
MQNAVPIRLQLGVFELDLKAGELRKGANRVRLQEQPFQVLLILVEHAGELVSRGEIKRKLWPNDTVVEFDHSINTAINKLRQALGDSADKPQYVETVGRRGYRLLVPVQCLGSCSDDGAASSQESATPCLQPELAGLIGKRVSHYRVLEIVGGGGMGLVYKAEDLKLGRPVALKFLPEELAGDPIALQRFEREARTASSLNHPNICTIYEVEEHEGQPFIVMELLEGETLRDRLAAASVEVKAVPLDELLNIAVQIATGLEAAHEQGIIHRDIKPANIFLTKKGTAKILDFGLAKLAVEAPESARVERGFSPASQPPSSLPSGLQPGDGLKPSHDNRKDSLERGPEAPLYPPATPAEATLTRTGVAMGTAGYMSPEQARGETLDAGTDLFSFGLVLYEMATGQRAFTGDTAAILKDAILNNTPVAVRELNSTLPPKLEAIIGKAIEKDRERRYQTAEEVRIELEKITSKPKVGASSTLRRYRALAAVLLFIFISLAGGLYWKWRTAATFRNQDTTVIGDRLLAGPGARQEPAKEPLVRQLTSMDTVLLSITLSPEGKRLAYLDRAKGLSLLHIDLGETGSFPNTASFVPLSWLPDGDHILAAKTNEPGTWNISVVDGTVRRFYEKTLEHPHASPDGKQVVFGEGNDIWLTDVEGKSFRKILSVENLSYFGWSPTGQRIVYDQVRYAGDASKSHLTALSGAVPAELGSCSLDGRCSTILSESRLQLETGTPSEVVWLADGRLVFGLRESPPNQHSSNLWSLDVDPDSGQPRGEPKRLTNWVGLTQESLTASADGKRLALQRVRYEEVVKIAQLRAHGRELGPSRPLNSSSWFSRAAGWTADNAVLFTGTSYGKEGIFEQKPTEGGPRPLVTGPEAYAGPVVAPDGQSLFYTHYRKDGSAWLMRMPIAGGPATVVAPGNYGCRCARAPSNLCVLSELKGDQLIFWALDPFEGRGRELTGVELKRNHFGQRLYAWSVSPDGKNIALVDNGASGDQVLVLSLESGVSRALRLKGWTILQRVSWSADGSRLYVSGGVHVPAGIMGSAILETDLAGNINVLVDVPKGQAWLADPIPSPDGRYLVYTEKAWPSDVTILENF